MNKRVSKRKFGRKTDQRKAFLKSLANNLILRERIITTEARAKEVRPLVEKLVTKGAKDDFVTARYLVARLSKAAAVKVRKDLGKRYAERKGGYLRIIKIFSKRHDGAKEAIIEFIK